MTSLGKMACNQFLKLGLVGLGVGMFAATSALAAPAPLFEPILDELATSKFPVRLPTAVPADVALYPSVRQIRADIHILTVGVTPDCTGERCLGFNIVTIPEPGPWPAADNRLTPITPVVLGNGIQGYSAEARGFASVEWMQDGSLYILNYRTTLLSTEDAIAMATSMVTEPPVSEAQ